MAVDTTLYSWKTDFSGADTNVPANESTIGTDLGEHARDIKGNIRKDLSRFDNSTTPAHSVGKAYALYKSESDTGIDDGNDYNIRIRNVSNSDLIRPTFDVVGNYGSLFFPGTRFAVASSYSDLNKESSAVVTSVQYPMPNQADDSDTNEYTRVTYSPVLNKMDRTHVTGLETNDTADGFYIQFSSAPSGYYPGQRITFVKTTTSRVSGNGYSGSSKPFPTETFSAVVKKIIGDGKLIILYNSPKELAQDVDDYTEAQAESLFPSGVLAPQSTGWAPTPGSNVYLLASKDMRVINETDFLLVGSQSGSWDYNGIQHRSVSVRATVSGELEAGGEYLVNFASLFFPYVNPTKDVGKDVRVKAQCVDVEQGNVTSIPSDCFFPTVKMNSWSTTSNPWDTLSSAERTVTQVILIFQSGIPDGTTMTFDITVTLPMINGPTFYKPA